MSGSMSDGMALTKSCPSFVMSSSGILIITLPTTTSTPKSALYSNLAPLAFFSVSASGAPTVIVVPPASMLLAAGASFASGAASSGSAVAIVSVVVVSAAYTVSCCVSLFAVLFPHAEKATMAESIATGMILFIINNFLGLLCIQN